MKIELTKEQYKNLVDLVQLGDWLINATRNKTIEKYDQTVQLIFSHSKEFSFNNMDFQRDFNLYELKPNYEEKLHKYIDEYDDYTFWEQLSMKLAERDFLRQVGPRRFTEEHMELKDEIEEKYLKEFEKNGLKNIELKK